MKIGNHNLGIIIEKSSTLSTTGKYKIKISILKYILIMGFESNK